MKKRAIAIFMALILMQTLIPVSHAVQISAPGSFKSIRTSSLFENPEGNYDLVYIDGYRLRYQDGSTEDNRVLTVCTYSQTFKLLSTQEFPIELPEFAGFFAGENYNFFAFGQDNFEENNAAEVLRVVRYSKDWERIDAASIYGANTIDIVGQHGNLSFAEYGGVLYLHMGHAMFKSSDGLNHQANMTVSIRQSDMEVTDQWVGVYNYSTGYVSHALSQDILVDSDGNIVTLDTGDGYPRGAMLFRYGKKAGNDKFTGLGEPVIFTSWPGQSGNVNVGASTTALAETKEGYLSGFIDTGVGSNYTGKEPASAYLAFTPKNNFTEQATQIHTLASFSTGSQESAGFVYLVPTSDSDGYVLWYTREKKDSGYYGDYHLYYATYSSDGALGETHALGKVPMPYEGPIYSHGKIVWANSTEDLDSLTFCTLDDSGLKSFPVGTTSSTQPEIPPTPSTPITPDTPSVETVQSSIMVTPNSTFSTGLALQNDGSLVGWGNGLAQWDKTWNGAPIKLNGSYVSVWGDSSECFMLKEDGTLWYLGGYLAHLGRLEESVFEPIKVLNDVAQFDGGVVLKKDGSVWSLTPLSVKDYNSDLFYHIMDGAKQISGSAIDGGFGMALKTDGTLWSWGDNSDGALGRTTSDTRWCPPGKVMDNVAYVSGTMAIRTDGTLWSWGNNYFGGVGNGGDTDQLTPVKILDGIISAHQGGFGMMTTKFALSKDGSLYSWGYNSCSQLGYSNGNKTYVGNPAIGDSSFPYQATPRKVSIDNVASVYATNNTLLVLKTNGTLWGIGSNVNGECGVKNSKFIDSFVMVLEHVKCPPSVQQNTNTSFSDIATSAYCYDAVQWAVANNITNGTSKTTFSPNKTCSRGEIITFLWRATGSPTPQVTTNPFTDVPSGTYCYEAILWAYEHGMIAGTTFSPNSLCTRAMAVEFMWKAAGSPKVSQANFNDVPAEYTFPVAWAVKIGITEGTSSTTFSPNDFCTRGQIVTFLYRGTK